MKPVALGAVLLGAGVVDGILGVVPELEGRFGETEPRQSLRGQGQDRLKRDRFEERRI
jgi:hypothetical protein